MGKVLGIDFGLKRTGLAITDSAQIIASPLDFVESGNLMAYLIDLIQKEKIEAIAVGLPMNLNNTPTDLTPNVYLLKEALEKQFIGLPVILIDERFTSSMALSSMISGGASKKQRQTKGNVDKVSAAIILQSYLEMRK
jgi:putative Holliday junction resolvase